MSTDNAGWRWHRVMGLLLVVTLVAAACGGNGDATDTTPTTTEESPDTTIAESSDTTQDDSDTAATTTPGDSEMEDFVFQAWSLSEGFAAETIQGYVDQFEADNTVTVETDAAPYGEYLNKLILEGTSGTFQGAAQLDIAWLSTLATAGILRDLGPQAAGVDYTEGGLETGTFDGVQYGLPWTTASIGMVANSELLEEAGISEIPETVEEFEAALEALQGLGPDFIPYAAMTDTAQLKDIIPWIWQFGGTIIDENGNVTLGDEGSVRAVEWMRDLLDSRLIAPDIDRTAARTLFAEGRVGFYEDAILAPGIAESNADAEFAANIVPVPRPVVDLGDDPESLFWGHVVVVVDPEGTEESAAEFARWLTSDTEVVTDYFEALSLPPTTETALSSDAVTGDEFTTTWTNEITAFSKKNPFWPYADAPRMESILTEAIQAVLLGGDAEAVLTEAAEQIQALVDAG